jgi:hypothetical protein
MRSFILLGGTALLSAPLFGQWELGGVGGWAYRPTFSVQNGTGNSANAGFNNGYAWGFTGGLTEYKYLGGEASYLYEGGGYKVKSGSDEATFKGYAQTVHFDLVMHTAPRTSKLRPFVGFGGGVRFYKGTGQDEAYQPLSDYVLLTRTNDTKALVTGAGGIKYRFAEHWLFRVEARYFGTPRPTGVLAPAPGATSGGWMNDVVGLFGFSGVW